MIEIECSVNLGVSYNNNNNDVVSSNLKKEWYFKPQC